jgi:multisubunit Na+/H+ antiporter MnhF subunit
MNGYTAAALTLLVGGLGPGAWLSIRGSAQRRLVGLAMSSAVTVLLLMLVSEVAGESSMLILPIVLVVLSAAGTLVFTRLLAPQADDDTHPADH